MTGWRCGWAVGPGELIKACNAIQSNATSNANSIAQRAALAALTGPQECVTAMLDEYRERRDKVFAWMTEDPLFTCVKPRGAFYLFPYAAEALDASGVRTTNEFAEQLLQESHVALTAGEGFDAPGYLRISYAASMEDLREGANRILRFAESLQPARAAASR
jgi:aspartate aminotransferase